MLGEREAADVQRFLGAQTAPRLAEAASDRAADLEDWYREACEERDERYANEAANFDRMTELQHVADIRAAADPTQEQMLALIADEITEHRAYKFVVKRRHGGWDGAMLMIHEIDGRTVKGFWNNDGVIAYGKTLEDAYRKITLTDAEIADLYVDALKRGAERAADAAQGGSGLRTRGQR